MKANIATLVIIVLGMTFLGIHYAHESWTPMRIAAVIIGLPSLLLLIVARIELGGSSLSGRKPRHSSRTVFILGFATLSTSLGR